MNVSQEALLIMYSSSKMFLQQRIEACVNGGIECEEYKRQLEIVEKAWSDYLNGINNI